MKRKIFLVPLLAMLFLNACQKNLDYFVADPGQLPDSTWYNEISSAMPVGTLQYQLLLPVQKDSFTLDNPVVTVSASTGLTCTFNEGSLLNTLGQQVNGKIYLESYLVKKKGDMIRMGTPTTSNSRLLVSGGELFVRLFTDSSELSIAPGNSFSIEYGDSPISSSISLFNGDETNPAVINWLPVTDSLSAVIPLAQSYHIISSKLRWLNCDYFYDTTGIAQTKLVAALPASYTNANTIAYVVLNDFRSVVSMYGNQSTRNFSTGLLPVNKQITVVIISKQGDDYYLGHEQATTTSVGAPDNIQRVSVDPVRTTLTAINNYLNGL